jgi:rRNA processing protein Gar1
MNSAEEYLVIQNILPDRVPIFNRGVYLENKEKIGIIDDVFGPINEFMVSVKCDTGIVPKSFKEGQKVYIIFYFNRFIWILLVSYLLINFYLNQKELADQVEEEEEVEEEALEVEIAEAVQVDSEEETEAVLEDLEVEIVVDQVDLEVVTEVDQVVSEVDIKY